MADPDLQIREGGRGEGQSSRPRDKGGGGTGLFRLIRPLGLKIRGGRAPPLDRLLVSQLKQSLFWHLEFIQVSESQTH